MFQNRKIISRSYEHPKSFLYLFKTCKLLCFYKNSTEVWNLDGERQLVFEDRAQIVQASHCVTVSKNQQYVVSVCKDEDNLFGSEATAIHISNIRTGKCVSRIESAELFDVTCIGYDDDDCYVCVGDEEGKIHLFGH